MPIFKSPAAMTQTEVQQSCARWEIARVKIAGILEGIEKFDDARAAFKDKHPAVYYGGLGFAVSMMVAVMTFVPAVIAIAGLAAGDLAVRVGGMKAYDMIEDRVAALDRAKAQYKAEVAHIAVPVASAEPQTGPSMGDKGNWLSAAFAGRVAGSSRQPTKRELIRQEEDRKKRIVDKMFG